METIEKLEVYLDSAHVGTMALYKKHLAAFEYCGEWLETGFSISPFKIPFTRGVYIPQYDPFNGLPGIFADSLPDGWGRLLVDRMLLSNHVDPSSLGILNRLSIVGDAGMGALEYRPAQQWKDINEKKSLDFLAAECRKILASETCDDIDALFRYGGSSGGARPKALMTLDGEEWIIKFPSSMDPEDVGEMEYSYALCAAKCGIIVPEVKLFESKICSGYFGVKRFDRKKSSEEKPQKVHMASVSALLDVSHRIPSMDYNTMMALTWQLTKDYAELDKMFRLMCFNVFAHNRDDHSKNFSYIYDKEQGWRLSPAYDLTYSYSIGGEHATSVNGNRKDPGLEDLLCVASKAGIDKQKAKNTAEEIREITAESLKKYLN